MGVQVEILGVPELIKYMNDKQAEMRKQLPDSVKEATLYLQARIKESIAQGVNASVAVDTGRFLNSVDFETTGENSSRIFSDLEYAQFVEYGTSRMGARPHFQNTLFVNEANLKAVFGDAMSVIFK